MIIRGILILLALMGLCTFTVTRHYRYDAEEPEDRQDARQIEPPPPAAATKSDGELPAASARAAASDAKNKVTKDEKNNGTKETAEDEKIRQQRKKMWKYLQKIVMPRFTTNSPPVLIEDATNKVKNDANNDGREKDADDEKAKARKPMQENLSVMLRQRMASISPPVLIEDATVLPKGQGFNFDEHSNSMVDSYLYVALPTNAEKSRCRQEHGEKYTACPGPRPRGREQCIRLRKLCDGRRDCKSGGDEHEVLCMYFRLNGRKELDINEMDGDEWREKLANPFPNEEPDSLIY